MTLECETITPIWTGGVRRQSNQGRAARFKSADGDQNGGLSRIAQRERK